MRKQADSSNAETMHFKLYLSVRTKVSALGYLKIALSLLSDEPCHEVFSSPMPIVRTFPQLLRMIQICSLFAYHFNILHN